MKYLINLTFYAGSNDPEDTDNGCFILVTDEPMSNTDIKKQFKLVDSILYDRFVDDEPTAPNADKVTGSYEDGINIDTLVNAFEEYTGFSIQMVHPGIFPTMIDGYYEIVQWQGQTDEED